MYVWSSHIAGLTVKIANPARGQLNRENYIFPVPVRAWEFGRSGTGSAVPSSVSPLILHTQQAESDWLVHLMDFSRVLGRHPSIVTVNQHRVSPEFIRPRNCVSMTLTSEGPPAFSRSRLRIWSRGTGSAVPSSVSPFILHTQQAESDWLVHLMDFSGFLGRHPSCNRQPTPGQCRVHQVTQLRFDDVNFWGVAGVLKVVPETGVAFSGSRTAGHPGGSVGNLETFWRWDLSSNLGVVTRNRIFSQKKKMPNKWRTIKCKIRLHGRRVMKGTAEAFSREKLRQAPQKKSGWEILCDLPPVWPRLVRPQTWRPEKMDDSTHTHGPIVTRLSFSLSPLAPNNLVARDRFNHPVPRQPAHSPYCTQTLRCIRVPEQEYDII